MSKNTDELKMLQKEIDAIPESNTARSAWKALGFVMTALKGTMNDFSDELRAFKEDVSERFLGLENDVRKMRDDIHLIQSNTNTTKNIVSQMTNGKDKKEEPKSVEIPERKWFIDKVLPGLVQAVIMAIVATLVTLVVTHYVP